MAQVMTNAGLLDLSKFAGSQDEAKGRMMRLWLYDPTVPGGRREYTLEGDDIATVKGAIWTEPAPKGKTTVVVKKGRK